MSLSIRILISIIFFNGLYQTQVLAFRVFPTTAQNELMFDKSNFPFIAANADGFNVQYDSFGPFSDIQVATIFNQFTNKNLINHGVFRADRQIVTMSTMPKLPSFANVTAFMLYSEAPAMSAADWTSALSQNAPWPLITHCRAYAETSQHNEMRSQILRTSGVMFEFQVTDPGKFDDAAALMKYCVDNDRLVVFLITFQRTPDIFISAVKEFYYYLKENLGSEYLDSDNVIFIPNTYFDTQVFPETKGYGSTFGVAHWLIDQKSRTSDGYIQPEISFTNINDHDYYPNHSSLTVNLNVNSSLPVTNVKLYMDSILVGEDTAAPFSWNSGVLSDLTTGYKQLKAVVTDASGVETSKAIEIRILGDPIELPGLFQASEINAYNLRNIPDYNGFIRHVYGNEWIDYEVDVKHAGAYDVSVDIKIQRSKQFGGSIILMSGNREIGRFNTILNDPAKDPLPGFTEKPDILIRNVELSAGLQKIRVRFAHPNGIIRPQFYLFGLNFKKQGAPDITFTTPIKNEAGEYNSFNSPATVKLSTNVVSPRSEGSVKEVRLYMSEAVIDTDNILPALIPDIRPQLDFVLVETLSEPPFNWNDVEDIAELNDLPAGNYVFKVVAEDELGYKSFEEINLSVIDRIPFNPNLSIPGVIKSWEFDLGGQGTAYNDFNAGYERGLSGTQNPRYNKAGDEDVEIEMSAGQHVVSAIRNGEWLNYTIANVQKGVYDIILTTAANADKTADVNVWFNNKKIATVPIEETGSGFTIYRNFKVSGVEIPKDYKNGLVRLEFVNPAISNYLCFFRSFEFKKTAEVSIDNTSFNKWVNIYPNPSDSYFKVSISNTSKADVVVWDISGKQILKMENVSNEITIQRSQIINSGIYFISVYSTEFGVVTKKMVLQ